MAPLTKILAFLLMCQTAHAGTCPSDQDVLMQVRAAAMTNTTLTDGECTGLTQSVYSALDVGGGPFAVAQDGTGNLLQCNRAEGKRTAPTDVFCQCQVNPFTFRPRQIRYFTPTSNEFVQQTTDPSDPLDWSTVTPGEPARSAERCFRAGQNDPQVVTPNGFNYSCSDPTGKTDRDPHRSCRFNHLYGFSAGHVQEVPPNTQVVGYCVQRVDNPNDDTRVRNYPATCHMVPSPARCSSSVSTFQLPNFETRTFSFLLRCCDPLLGEGVGDPHIHSLRGAHYTLLSQGNFVAWSYSKGPAGTEAELFASYAGSRFTTQALALKTKGSTEANTEMLEITAHDCQWRAKSFDKWIMAESKDFSQSNVEVKPPTKGGRLYTHASILLTSADPVRKLAKLTTMCKPGGHIDFKVKMFSKDDLQYIGGQLGSAPDDRKTTMLASGLTRLEADAKFKAGEWLSLGGSTEAALFLAKMMGITGSNKSKPSGPVLLQSSLKCSESETDMARSICEKHFGSKKTLETELFEDCVFDVCSGGGEEAAASIIDMLSA